MYDFRWNISWYCCYFSQINIWTTAWFVSFPTKCISFSVNDLSTQGPFARPAMHVARGAQGLRSERAARATAVTEARAALREVRCCLRCACPAVTSARRPRCCGLMQHLISGSMFFLYSVGDSIFLCFSYYVHRIPFWHGGWASMGPT